MQSRKPRTLRSLPLLGISLLMLCVGCATTSPVGTVRCPEPNTEEIDDYASVVESGPDRPAVRWISRMIAYCWPDESEEARNG